MIKKRSPIGPGERFDLLVTVDKAGRANDGHTYWNCICDCGGQIKKSTNNLRAKKTKSCGCVGLKVQIEAHTTHGMRNSTEYNSWGSAKDRCHNPSSKDFHRYGAKGISMCDEWRNSFEEFYKYMGPKPKGTSLDRYPNMDGNYEPGNCRWATPVEQARNKKNSKLATWKGVPTPIAEIAKELGITYGATFMRHKRGKLYEPQ